MKITDASGDSYSPMMMEFEEITQATGNPRLLHLLRITSWPHYLNHVLQIQGKSAKDENGQWANYRSDVGWQGRTSWDGWRHY